MIFPSNRKIRKDAAIIFHLNILMQRIQDSAYLYCDTADMDDSKKALIKDIGQDENTLRSMQTLKMAIQEIDEMLGGFSKHPSAMDEATDNTDDEIKNVFTIRMKTPESFPRTELNTIQLQSEEYIIDRVLADWLSHVAPELEPSWSSKAEVCKQNIRHALTVRMRPLHRSSHPF